MVEASTEEPEEAPAETTEAEEPSAIEPDAPQEPEAPEIVVEYPLTTDGYIFTCWTTYGPGMEDYLIQINGFPAFNRENN